MTESQVLWPADCTYYLQLLRLLTNALMCCILALLLVWPGKSVLLSSQVSLPIIYSKAPHGLIPPDPFETHSRSCASQVGSLSRDTTLPPPIVHLLRLRAPLCMTVSPPGTLSEATCIAPDSKIAEMAVARFASGAIPSTSKLEASGLLKTGGIEQCFLLWRELL